MPYSLRTVLRSCRRTGAVWVVMLAAWGLLGGRLGSVRAQALTGTGAEALTSGDRPIRIVFHPGYQRFEDGGRTLTQWSFPVRVVVPFGDRWQASIRGGGVSAQVDDLPTLTGPTDVQAALSYAQPVGEGSVVINATVNAPTGQQELTREEFIAATFLSQDFYRFPVSSFGRGLGTGGSVTWATPVSEFVVVGVGGAFRYHSEYDPVAGREQKYNPGEEGRLTAGVDIQLNRVSALSADLSFVAYGTDTVGGVDQFDAGTHVSIRTQYLRRVDERTLRITGRFRQQEKSTLPVRSGSDRERQVLPSQGVLRGQYMAPLTDVVSIQVSAAGRWYDETAAFERKAFVTMGTGVGIGVGETVEITPRLEYTAGSVTGLQGGARLEARL